MRNVLIHRYFEIDRDAVWSAVAQALPALKAHISRLLASASSIADTASTEAALNPSDPAN